MWNKLARLKWHWRWLAKTALFALVVLEVLYPHPVLLVKQIQHLANIESLIDPNLPDMPQINREIDQELAAGATPEKEAKAVERYVYRQIKYEYDWNIWGNVDYWPTAAEVWALKREDCDGRAILAASILRARGFKDAHVVANLSHVWVAAGGKEWMGPQADKNFTREGGKTKITLPSLSTLAVTLAMMSEFPAVRSYLILAALLGLCFHPCRHWGGALTVGALGALGLLLLLKWGGGYLSHETRLEGGRLLFSLLLLSGSIVLAMGMPRVLALLSSWRTRGSIQPAVASAAGEVS